MRRKTTIHRADGTSATITPVDPFRPPPPRPRAGQCKRCWKRRATTGYATCATCRADIAANAKDRISLRLCMSCKGPSGEHRRCGPCLAIDAGNQRRARAERLALGLCPRCGTRTKREGWCRTCVNKQRRYAATRCPCGGTKVCDATACPECTNKDGTHHVNVALGLAIQDMRVLGGIATMAEFVRQVGCARKAHRWIAELRKAGRLLEVIDGVDVTDLPWKERARVHADVAGPVAELHTYRLVAPRNP